MKKTKKNKKSKMDIMYVYTKRRNQFGRQVYLADKGPELLCDILPNPELVELFIDRDTLDRPIQAAPDLSEHEVCWREREREGEVLGVGGVS